MKWDPEAYAHFAQHRNRPFFDLTARIAAPRPRLVVDMGCGAGPLTLALAHRWPDAAVRGMDSSPEMIARATQTQHAPNLEFALADAATWMPAPGTDVLVSNAMLQWLPDHQALLAAWLAALAPGAWFAAQVPGNFSSPSHTSMRELAASPSWSARLDGVLRHDDAVGEPEDYLKLMLDAGFEPDVWESTYGQLLEGPEPVLDWMRGTALRPVLDRLEPAERLEFEQEYTRLLALAYPPFPGPGGEALTYFPFRRIFIVGRKR